MSGECNYCGGFHTEDGCDAPRHLVYDNGHSRGYSQGHNAQNKRLDQIKADNAALREALARIAGVLDDPRWDGTREDGPRAMLDWCISVARKANPLAAAAVREAKEQA